MEQRELKIHSRVDCIRFLEAISRVNDACILTAHGSGCLSSLVSSADNTLILYAELPDITSNSTYKLNIPDIKRLIRVLDSLNEQTISFKVNTNNLEYRDDKVKFKYHLYEDGFLSPPPINVDKVKEFATDVTFTLTKEVIQHIIKSSSFTTDTNKLYLYEENGRLKGELTDRARHNTDMIALDLGECTFALQPIPVNLDNIKLLSFLGNEVIFGINTKHGVTVIENTVNGIKLKYIITSLTQ